MVCMGVEIICKCQMSLEREKKCSIMNQRVCYAPKEGKSIHKDENTLILSRVFIFLKTERGEPFVEGFFLSSWGLELSMPKDDTYYASLLGETGLTLFEGENNGAERFVIHNIQWSYRVMDRMESPV